MKIAYFLDIASGLGGAGNILLMQARLMAKFHEVIVVIPINDIGKENPDYVFRCEKNSLHHLGLSYKTSYNFHNIDLFKIVESMGEIREFLTREKIEFVHSVQLNVAVEMVSREMRIPHLMDIYQLERVAFKMRYGDLYPYFHLCDSKLYSDIWAEELKIESRVLRASANNTQIVKKETYVSDKYVVLMLGEVCERKNQIAAIQAIEKLRGQLDLQLIIAGNAESKYGLSCKEYIKLHQLEDQISMVGFVNDVENLLKNSNWLLCTSYDESFPSAIIEAMTYDLAVVSTPVAGVPEVLHNRENAFLSLDFSVEGIKEALMDCFECSKQGNIAEIHQNAWETWEKYFNPEINAQSLNCYYGEIVEKTKHLERQAGTVNELFDRMCKMWNEIERKCFYPDKYKEKCLYYSTLLPKLEKKSAYIWGAGKCGEQANDILMHICPQVEVVAFVDSFKTGNYCGKSIIRPEEIICEDAYVFVAFAGDTQRVIKCLEKMGFQYGQDIWLLP